ncbi:MAG: glycosyltransferase family 2 protein, partial [Acidimicrobiales bacterium]
ARTGYVVIAAPGADAGAGHDDAALHAARHVLPLLLARGPTAFLRVVVDDPSPALQLLAGPHVELVPAGDDPARWLRRSRVCLAWYPRGHGWRHALTLAIDTGTPFVTTEAALEDAGAGGLAALAAAGDALSASLLAQQLHDQPRLWEAFHGQLGDLARGPRSPATARLKLLRACAGAAIAPRSGVLLDEPAEPAVGDDVALEVRPRSVSAVGSAWKAAPPLPDHPSDGNGAGADLPVNEQYHRWLRRYGPTTRRLTTLRARMAGLVRRPTISIVMPVFNTEPSWLHDAISSVRSQAYQHWELCVGDDGSTSPATLDVLEQHLGQDSRIRLVRLPGNQGIAAASNAALSLATGEFVGFLDHDDELKAHALGEVAVLLDDQPRLDIVYSDEDKRDPDGQLVDPFFKSDWSPDHLMSRNYVCHFLVVRRRLLQELGGFRLGYDGSQDYDLLLRAMERTDRIAHLHEPLYTWRKVAGSTASVGDAKPWALDSARRALKDALERRGTPGEVEDGLHPTTYRVRYAIRGQPKVSIIIPTRDRVDLLRGCIESILETSTYSNYEFVVVDNQSTDPETLAYLAEVPRGAVVRYPHRFNYARMMNLAAHEATGDMLLFLNNDTKVVAPEWIEALVEHGQRPEVGSVGARLLYPQGHVQHEGIIVGHKGGHAGNVDHGGYWGLGQIVRNCSAVTGACMLMRPSVYWRIGGHEERLRIAYNDVDICLRARQAGYEVVYTPYAELVHVEGGTRGIHAHVDDDDFFEARWVTHKCLDRYYNANLERLEPFRIRA